MRRPGEDSPQFLDLSLRERALCHALYMGLDREEIAAQFGTNPTCVAKAITRIARRYGYRQSYQLVVRYMVEYLGVGEPYSCNPWEEYLEVKGRVERPQRSMAAGV